MILQASPPESSYVAYRIAEFGGEPALVLSAFTGIFVLLLVVAAAGLEPVRIAMIPILVRRPVSVRRVTNYGESLSLLEILLLLIGSFTAAFWASSSNSGLPLTLYFVLLSVLLIEIACPANRLWLTWTVLPVLLLPMGVLLLLSDPQGSGLRLSPDAISIIEVAVLAISILIATAVVVQLRSGYGIVVLLRGRSAWVEWGMAALALLLAVGALLRSVLGTASDTGLMAFLPVSRDLQAVLDASIVLELYRYLQLGLALGFSLYVILLSLANMAHPQFPLRMVPPIPPRHVPRALEGIVQGIRSALNAALVLVDAVLRIVSYVILFLRAFAIAFSRYSLRVAGDLVKAALTTTRFVILPVTMLIFAGVCFWELGNRMQGLLLNGTGRPMLMVIGISGLIAIWAGISLWTLDRDGAVDLGNDALALGVVTLICAAAITVIFAALHVPKYHIGQITIATIVLVALGGVYALFANSEESGDAAPAVAVRIARPYLSVVLASAFIVACVLATVAPVPLP